MKQKGKFWMAAAALGLCALLAGCSGSQISQDTALKTALDHAGVAQEDTTSLSVKEGKEAVSYTHLDVYKRQGLCVGGHQRRHL